MTSTNITTLRKDIFKIFEQAIKFNQPTNITTKDGNAVIISEEDYNSLIETIYISSIPKLKESIVEELNTKIEDCIPENEVNW